MEIHTRAARRGIVDHLNDRKRFSSSVKKPKKWELVDYDKAFESVYGHNLQLYSVPPIDVISLLEFETLAVERLKVLKAVEQAAQNYQKNSNEYFTALSSALRKLSFRNFGKFTSFEHTSDEDLEDRRRDHISHFVLRLAFCKSPDQRQWFLQQEVDLFKFRFGLEGPKSILRFLSLNGLIFDVVDGKSLTADETQSIADATGLDSLTVESCEIFKVPFTEALDLVRKRKVFLKNGMAYVFHSDLIVIITARFRTAVSLSMTLSESSFPLCMLQLHTHLRRNHHLKHGGRMQYGLFLKGIGLSLEDAMVFWRSEFTKLMESEKFDKQYAYNIRHNYGKEGKRADYTPYSCRKITQNRPGPQENHGCPFRETDPVVLRQQLQALRISSEQCDKVVCLAQSGQFESACSRFFEYRHSLPENSLNQLIAHPNQYFEESRKYRSGEKAPTEVVPTQSSRVFGNVVPPLSSSMEEDDDDELLASIDIP